MNIITLHHENTAKTMLFEEEIIDYILYSRALANAVKSNRNIFKLWSLNETFREKMENTSKMVRSFYEKAFSYFQKNTHISQRLPEKKFVKIQEFLCYNIKLRIKYILNWIQ